MDQTVRISAMVLFFLLGATVFSLVFQGVNGGRWIEHLLSGIPGGQLKILIFVNIFIFFLAFFLDFFEILFIVVPMLLPTAIALDINLVWFGVLLCVNMQTSSMHPPFGFALFYLRGIAPPLVLIFFGWESVTYWLGQEVVLDAATVGTALDALPMPTLKMPALDLGN